RVLRVDPESDPPLPAPVELAEAVNQQSLRKTAAAIRRTNADRTDPTAAASLGVVPSRRRDVLVGSYQEPQRRVVIRPRDLSFPPLIERGRLGLPVIRERLLERGVETTCELRGERLDPKPVWQLRIERRVGAEL